MKRDLYHKLVTWKVSEDRKPLLLRGARQVGKTYLLKEFGNQEYKNIIYLDFDEDPDLNRFFTKNLDPERIIRDLAIYFGETIYPHETLLFFDEIQESPHALNSLKYFNEKANSYHVVAAGSLLGVKLAKNKGFPVGKVTFADLYPASFFEFLTAMGKDRMRTALETKEDQENLAEPIHEELISLLKSYYIVGGMPEAIKKHLLNPADLTSVRKIQRDILDAYELDVSKHAEPYEAIKILKVWRSIPTQLAKEHKKFMFSKIHQNARGREYADAIEWLEHAGLILKSNLISTPKFPLGSYLKESAYKIFLLDVGLLGSMSRLPPQIILEGNQLFTEFKGALTENFVAQELKGKGDSLYYWSNDQYAEVDFILLHNTHLIPLEVKANRGKKTKSLQVYLEKFSPRFSVRTSLRNFTKDGSFLNIPLYSISHFQGLLQNCLPL